MANKCYTGYIVLGPKKDRKKLFELSKSLITLDENGIEQAFWLGDLVEKMGGNPYTINCNGELGVVSEKNADNDDGRLYFSTCTTWEPAFDVNSFLKEQFPSLEFIFQGRDNEATIFVTNDLSGKFFPEKFYLSVWNNESDEDEYFFKSEEELYTAVNKITGRKDICSFEDMKKALESKNELEEGFNFYFMPYELIDDKGLEPKVVQTPFYTISGKAKITEESSERFIDFLNSDDDIPF